MQYYLALLSIPFFYLNYKIILSDIKEKKIPNKFLGFLLLLLPFYYVYIFNNFEINILRFFSQIILSTLVSFVLYYIGIWSAGDAKYLLVLGLFIPNIGIIPFVGNIAFLTIIYLFLYFLYFYFWRCIFVKGYAKSLFQNIYTDLNDNLSVFLEKYDNNNSQTKTFYKILKWFVVFLILFVSLRLARLYIFQHLITKSSQGDSFGIWGYFFEILKNNSEYIVLIALGGFFLGLYLLSKFLTFSREFIAKHLGIKRRFLSLIFIILLVFGLISYIFIEFRENPSEISHNLKLIFTLYLALFLIFKILRYSYKITFQLGEQDYISIEKLKSGEIVDKTYLVKMFGTQSSLGYKNDEGILSPDPSKYFENLENPIDEETKNKLQEIFKIVNEHHKNNETQVFQEIKDIKVLKTFAFGIYIFSGFMISYFLGNYIFEFLIKNLFKFFHYSSI